MIKGGLPVYFFAVAQLKKTVYFLFVHVIQEQMTLSLSLATFFSIKLSFLILFSSASSAHPSQEGL